VGDCARNGAKTAKNHAVNQTTVKIRDARRARIRVMKKDDESATEYVWGWPPLTGCWRLTTGD
jgi:hypothetical protein